MVSPLPTITSTDYQQSQFTIGADGTAMILLNYHALRVAPYTIFRPDSVALTFSQAPASAGSYDYINASGETETINRAFQ